MSDVKNNNTNNYFYAVKDFSDRIQTIRNTKKKETISRNEKRRLNEFYTLQIYNRNIFDYASVKFNVVASPRHAIRVLLN